MRYFLSRSAVLAAGFALLLLPSAHAQESEFLRRFEGEFVGRGSVIRNKVEDVASMRCTMRGATTANAMRMDGTCRAGLIFSRRIGASLKIDGAGRYTGTYVGSSIGPAALAGRRTGDSINLTITWPETVRGDRTARMTIRNVGGQEIAIVITDEVPAGGPVTQVTNIVLRRT